MRKFILNIILLFFLFSSLIAQEMEVDTKIQMSLISKILMFDRNLKTNPFEVTILIIYQKNFKYSLNVKREIEDFAEQTAYINNLPVRYKYLSIDAESELLSYLSQNRIAAVYIAPLRKIDFASLVNICNKKKVLTVTGVNEYIDDGVAVGIRKGENKYKIIIDMEIAKKQEADFSSQLLKIAEIK